MLRYGGTNFPESIMWQEQIERLALKLYLYFQYLLDTALLVIGA